MAKTAKSLIFLISLVAIFCGVVAAQDQSAQSPPPSIRHQSNFPGRASPSGAFYADTLFVRINTVSISETSFVHGLVGAFPTPVLSFISIADEQGRPITGLADTLRWLGVDEIANNGRRIGDIWRPVLEYHEANPAVPADPDVTHQTPGLLVTEVTAREPLQVNTVIAMDHSGSMRGRIETAKAAARTYVEHMRNGDQAAVVKFASEVRVAQNFTSDRRLLIQAVNRQPAGGRTLLYDALIRSVELIKTQSNRRAVIAYTDGFDNISAATVQAVIDSANAYGIPIFTIGIGDSVSTTILQEIAIATGGIFLFAPTADELEAIFLQLSTVINNYYVTAHTSTDPERNNTWRVVDVTVNHDGRSRSATGRYFVPARMLKYDVAISQNSTTDSVGVVDGRVAKFARPGETYFYQLRLTNVGRETVRDIFLTSVFPDSIVAGDFSIKPISSTADSATWLFNALDADSSIFVDFKATVPTVMPAQRTALINVARIVAERDTLLANNFSADTVYAVGSGTPPPPRQSIDVAISQVSITDSISIANGDTTKIVTAGETYAYQLRVSNVGDSTASNIRLTNIFADSISASGFSINPTNLSADSAQWQFANLSVGGSIIIGFNATVRPAMPEQRTALINIARVIADGDTLLANNFSADTVYAVSKQPPPPPISDVAISQKAITDSISIVNGDTTKYVRPGETYAYELRITNVGEGTARNIRLANVFADSVTVAGFNVAPAAINADSAQWQFAELAVNDFIEIYFYATVHPVMPLGATELINTARVEADQDTIRENNISVDNTVVAVNVGPPPPKPRIDVAVAQVSSTDSISVAVGDTTKIVKAGETYAYQLRVSNVGDSTTSNIRLTNIFADSISASGFSIDPTNLSADSALWQFGELAAAGSITIDFNATVRATMPQQRTALINIARVIADGDALLANNFSADTVYAVDQQPPRPPVSPEIVVFPASVQVGDTIEVSVRTLAPLVHWDVVVHFADGAKNETYADAFIGQTTLQPGVWHRLDPKFGDTRLRTDARREEIVFELQSRDIYGDASVVKATAVVQSANAMVLDRNVFEPASGQQLAINFRLSSNRVAVLELLDITGRRVTRLAEKAFDAGRNELLWDGRTENGDLVGSGVYLVTIKSAEFNSWRKVVVVR